MKPHDKDCVLSRNEEDGPELERSNFRIKLQDDSVLSTSHDNRNDETELTLCDTSQTAGGNRLIVVKICSKIVQIGKKNNIKINDEQSREEDQENESVDENRKDMSDKPQIQRPEDIAKNSRSQEIESSEESTCSDTPITQESRRIKPRSRKLTPGILNIKVSKSIGPADPSSSCKLFFEISDEVMKELQVFRDNGEWDLFEKATNCLRERLACIENDETSLIIKLEQSMVVCYQNKLEESERMILEVIEKSENIENSSPLKRRAHIYLSGVYRKMGNKTGKADTHTEIAEKIGGAEDLYSNSLDSTFVAYERASVLMDFMATCRNPKVKSQLKERAKACLKKCIDISLVLEEDTSKQRYIKKNQFALIKIAMLVLDCRTTAARKKDSVSQSDIDEAKDSLAALGSYWDDMARGEKLQHYLAMADLKWRQNYLLEAQKFASEASAIAKDLGFGTEIKPAKDRLNEIQVKLQDLPIEHSAIEKNGLVTGSVHSASESDSSVTDGHFYGSSSCETDDPSTLQYTLL